VFSNLNFIKARDSVLVLRRVMLSILCCRMILMWAYLEGKKESLLVSVILTGSVEEVKDMPLKLVPSA